VFDFRYHALSLVAVFLALSIGLLLGVAIGDKGLVSSAERDIRSSLRRDVRDARNESDRLRADLNDEKQLEQRLYPLMTGGRLPGGRVGIIAFGSAPDGVVRNVRDGLAPTGGTLGSVSVVKIPPDTDRLTKDLDETRFAALATDPATMNKLGRRLGIDFVRSGRVLKRERGVLLSSSSGSLSEPLTGVVLIRAGGEQGGPDGAATTALEDGIVTGLRRTGVPIVGVEEESKNPSGITWFKQHDISSVDNIDQLTGRTSMVFVLGGTTGDFGVKDTADRLLPQTAPGA
jgi:Copper transport outer membrane protein, MctB